MTLCWLTTLVPPFQSPDEVDHLKRAYLLSQGEWQLKLGTVSNASISVTGSGGMIDQGLLAFMDHHLQFIARPELTRTTDSERVAQAIRWQGERVFSLAPGTGYYLPLIYAPQAMALKLGEKIDFSLAHSYLLTRLFAITCIGLLVWLATRLYPVPPLALGILSLPMALFQMSSASLDGLTCALALVCLAGFMRLISVSDRVRFLGFFAWCIGLLILVGSRAQMLPILILPFVVCGQSRRSPLLACSLATLMLALFWMVFAAQSTVDPRVRLGLGTAELIRYYMVRPMELGQVLYTTWSNSELLRFYWQTFIGVLGWIDTPMQPVHYFGLSGLLLALGALSFTLPHKFITQIASIALGLVASSSLVFVFLAMLVTWTPHPAETINGVQGRYFLIPSLVLAYAIFQPNNLKPIGRTHMAWCTLIALMAWSTKALHQTLTMRYPMFNLH